MAGHARKKGLFFLPRSGLEPPEELSKKVFPFIEGDVDLVIGRSPTAMAFLQLLKRLHAVIPQDVAVMKLMDINHTLFQLPVFGWELFSNFMSDLKAYISTSVCSSIANIDSVLPGVQAKIDNVHSDIRGQLNLLVTKVDTASARLENVATLSHLQGILNHIGQ